MDPVPSELEQAWPHLVAGEVDHVIQLLIYVDGPHRRVREIAESLKQHHPGRERAWLHARNVRLAGQTPVEVLRIDADGTWKDVQRALLRHEDRIDSPRYPGEDPCDA